MILPIKRPEALQDQPIRVLLLGHGVLARGVLEGLLTHPAVALIGVFPWSQRLNKPSFKDAGDQLFLKRLQEKRIPVLRFSSSNQFDFIQALTQYQPELVIIASWGERLKPHVLELPTQFINCHPALLPQYRGANPYAETILAGETESGLSLHMITAEIDAGPILLQHRVPILPGDTGGDLRARCANQAPEMIRAFIEGYYSANGIQPITQDPEQASYFKPLELERGLLNWQNDPNALERQVRAYLPWIPCYSFVNGKWLISFEALKIENTSAAQKMNGHNALPAGTIIAYTHGKLRISSHSPEHVFYTDRFNLYAFGMKLPQWLSKQLGYILLRPKLPLTA